METAPPSTGRRNASHGGARRIWERLLQAPAAVTVTTAEPVRHLEKHGEQT